MVTVRSVRGFISFPDKCKSLKYQDKFGGHTWARTKDPLIKSQLLYQLSYASIPFGKRRASMGMRAMQMLCDPGSPP